MLDATERPHRRPKDYFLQRALYSGKQADHTIKNTIVCDLDRYIHFVGKTTMGSVHDLALVRLDFPPCYDWFSTLHGYVDLGYQGFANHYRTKVLSTPFKATAKQALNAAQRAANKLIRSTRIVVEHAINGIKRFSCVVNRFRGRKADYFEHLIIRLCAGLWNLHLVCTT